MAAGHISPALALAVASLVLLYPLFGGQPPQTLRIGYQKYGILPLLKTQGSLEKRLAAFNVGVKWTEFPARPVMLEALNVGSIDFGTVGEAPPIFAQVG